MQGTRDERLNAIDELRRIDTPEAARALLPSLDSRSDDVRCAAAAAHYAITGNVTPGLRLLLNATKGQGVLTAYAQLRHVDVVPPEIVEELLAAEGLGPLGAIGALRLREGLPRVREALSSDDFARRAVAARALYEIEGAPEEPLRVLVLCLPKAPVFARRGIVSALLIIGRDFPGAVDDAMQPWLNGDDPQMLEVAQYILQGLQILSR